jgi:hypothetical protein
MPGGTIVTRAVPGADEAATPDVYTEVVRGIETQRWMFQAHLG